MFTEIMIQVILCSFVHLCWLLMTYSNFSNVKCNLCFIYEQNNTTFSSLLQKSNSLSFSKVLAYSWCYIFAALRYKSYGKICFLTVKTIYSGVIQKMLFIWSKTYFHFVILFQNLLWLFETLLISISHYIFFQ